MTSGDTTAVVSALMAAEASRVLLSGPDDLGSGVSSFRELERRYVVAPLREVRPDGTLRLVYWTGAPPSFEPRRRTLEVPPSGKPRFKSESVTEVGSPDELKDQRLRRLSHRDTWTRYYALEELAR